MGTTVYPNPSTVTFTIPAAPQGWICPKCGAVFSPNIATCWRCWPTHTPTPPTITA